MTHSSFFICKLMYAVYFWLISKLVNTNIIGNMLRGDHCAVWGCNNDRRYPEKKTTLPHVGILRFYSPKSKKDFLSWARSINRDHFKVTMSTKVCSNHFAQGYRTSECLTPTLSWKGAIVRVNLKDLPQRSDLHRSKRVAQGRESEIVTKVKFQLRMSPLWRTRLY